MNQYTSQKVGFYTRYLDTIHISNSNLKKLKNNETLDSPKGKKETKKKNTWTLKKRRRKLPLALGACSTKARPLQVCCA